MTQHTKTTQTTEIEPDLLAMVAMMVAVKNAEIREIPVTGTVIPFPTVL